MDWGIVASVLVALALFAAAVGILVLMMIGLFVWRMKTKMRKPGNTSFHFPDCCMKSAQNAQ
jgi:hypothetical protein